jgi:hypothetical protein
VVVILGIEDQRIDRLGRRPLPGLQDMRVEVRGDAAGRLAGRFGPLAAHGAGQSEPSDDRALADLRAEIGGYCSGDREDIGFVQLPELAIAA